MLNDMWNSLKWWFLWKIGQALLNLRCHGESSSYSGEFSAVTLGPLVVWESIPQGCVWEQGLSFGGKCLLSATEPASA